MCRKEKKVTRLSFFEKKEKSDRFRVLSQKGLLERILHKKSSHKSTHAHRERERELLSLLFLRFVFARREKNSALVFSIWAVLAKMHHQFHPRTKQRGV